MKKKILYIGGFELPDKNAAAQRVVGIAKGLRELGYEIVFLNSLKESMLTQVEEKEYFGFKCFEYKREKQHDYLFSAKSVLFMIRKIDPDAIIAYNYPAFSLSRIRKYCKKHKTKCYADVTEWYQAADGNFIYRAIKNFDTAYRMRYVQKKIDGVIAISRYLYDYYKDSVKTVIIPPTVDLSDEKWSINVLKDENNTSFVYAGNPSALKEKLDSIVLAIEETSKDHKVTLKVIGVTEQQFVEMYNWSKEIPDAVKFYGRLEHKRVIEIIKESNWAIILRENNRVVKAGFPTKLVEAISCGTPVIVNRFSNVSDYIGKNNGIVFENVTTLPSVITQSCGIIEKVDRTIFDYHNYLKELSDIFSIEN